MTEKRLKIMWAISLIVLGAGGLLNGLNGIFGGFLPDTAVRIIGVASLVAIPVLVFSSIRLRKNSSNNTHEKR